MSDQSRALPEQPNLRYLKIEAKRRLAAGEFTSLHDAQLAIAREHGFSSWTALKESIDDTKPVLAHVRWVTMRFQDADEPGWLVPDDDELREHFQDQYLALMSVPTLVKTLRGVAPKLRAELVVAQVTEQSLRVRLGDLRIEAIVEPDPPHRLTALRMYPGGRRVTDDRIAGPSTHLTGEVPDQVVRMVEASFDDLGLVGLVLAGPWTVTRGWADLDGQEPLRPDHRFPAYGVTKLVTSTAVLRLVADGVDLDGPANAYLRTLRLADDTVTVRELLTHTGGVTGPELGFAVRVPDQVGLLGSTVHCDGRRGTFAPSNGGYAVLGQLVADVTGVPWPDAVAELVLRPLGMHGSGFPTTRPAGAVTGYELAEDGTFEPAPSQVCTMPAAGGLWTTAPDLARFGREWSTLLPGELSREALRPQVSQPAGAGVGLGWLVHEAKDVCGHAGAGPGAAASVLLRIGTGAVMVACTNRKVPIEPVTARLVRAVA